MPRSTGSVYLGSRGGRLNRGSANQHRGLGKGPALRTEGPGWGTEDLEETAWVGSNFFIKFPNGIPGLNGDDFEEAQHGFAQRSDNEDEVSAEHLGGEAVAMVTEDEEMKDDDGKFNDDGECHEPAFSSPPAVRSTPRVSTAHKYKKSHRQAGGPKVTHSNKVTKLEVSRPKKSTAGSTQGKDGKAPLKSERVFNKTNRPTFYGTPKLLADCVLAAAKAGLYPEEHVDNFSARHPPTQNLDGTETPGNFKSAEDLEKEINAADSGKAPRRNLRAWCVDVWLEKHSDRL